MGLDSRDRLFGRFRKAGGAEAIGVAGAEIGERLLANF